MSLHKKYENNLNVISDNFKKLEQIKIFLYLLYQTSYC